MEKENPTKKLLEKLKKIDSNKNIYVDESHPPKKKTFKEFLKSNNVKK